LKRRSRVRTSADRPRANSLPAEEARSEIGFVASAAMMRGWSYSVTVKATRMPIW
jgi:hypothetical protein